MRKKNKVMKNLVNVINEGVLKSSGNDSLTNLNRMTAEFWSKSKTILITTNLNFSLPR